MMKHGSRPDSIIPGKSMGRQLQRSDLTGLDIQERPGQFLTGFLVEVAKVTGADWDEWRSKYPEAFARPYDPGAGLRFDAWVVWPERILRVLEGVAQ